MKDKADNKQKKGPLLLHSEDKKDRYWLLWSVAAEDAEDSDSDDSSDDVEDGVNYSVTPQAKATYFFCLRHSLSQRVGPGVINRKTSAQQ